MSLGFYKVLYEIVLSRLHSENTFSSSLLNLVSLRIDSFDVASVGNGNYRGFQGNQIFFRYLIEFLYVNLGLSLITESLFCLD